MGNSVSIFSGRENPAPAPPAPPANPSTLRRERQALRNALNAPILQPPPSAFSPPPPPLQPTRARAFVAPLARVQPFVRDAPPPAPAPAPIPAPPVPAENQQWENQNDAIDELVRLDWWNEGEGNEEEFLYAENDDPVNPDDDPVANPVIPDENPVIPDEIPVVDPVIPDDNPAPVVNPIGRAQVDQAAPIVNGNVGRAPPIQRGPPVFPPRAPPAALPRAPPAALPRAPPPARAQPANQPNGYHLNTILFVFFFYFQQI